MSTNRDSRHRTPREARNDARHKERVNPAWATEPNNRRSLTKAALAVGGSMAAMLLVIVLLMTGALENLVPGPEPTPTRAPIAGLTPPAVTPLASPPSEPAGDGTTATITTEMGEIVVELFTDSAPVATQNFINLAEAGYYEGVGFHRVMPGFMIQGGDPAGDGTGGPGYTIPDEPVVGEYDRGVVAMARTGQPNSAGSQFFIVVADSPNLDGGGYVIFGEVLEGMEVADEIVAGETTGPPNDRAVEPVLMTSVTIEGGS